ncbi:sensor domain-containing protein [Mycolicibacterium stellerae]|uniref:sensor domain-containing protein n=1 Tax=Mycolicibacterium stellerae TaxID=2358193 RepID=UPI000F0BD3AD|nr:sensor domain-containing protein [Mycolicibacterium stellerae]
MRSRRHPRLISLPCVVGATFSLLAGCATAPAADAPPKSVNESALTGLLLTADDIDAVMATSEMTAHPPVAQMADHRNLLPNLNCLGVWQVTEAPVYDPSGWQSVRQQMLRTPDSDSWDSLVVQSVVRYDTPEAAQRFFTESADRWAHCTNHRVNIRLNDQQLPAWLSGDLSASDSRLTMPYVRESGPQIRTCQHALALAANVILDIQACRPQQPTAVTEAADIADRIEARLPR